MRFSGKREGAVLREQRGEIESQENNPRAKCEKYPCGGGILLAKREGICYNI